MASSSSATTAKTIFIDGVEYAPVSGVKQSVKPVYVALDVIKKTVNSVSIYLSTEAFNFVFQSRGKTFKASNGFTIECSDYLTSWYDKNKLRLNLDSFCGKRSNFGLIQEFTDEDVQNMELAFKELTEALTKQNENPPYEGMKNLFQ